MLLDLAGREDDDGMDEDKLDEHMAWAGDIP